MCIITSVSFVIWQNNKTVHHRITGYVTNCLVYEGDYLTGPQVFQKAALGD